MRALYMEAFGGQGHALDDFQLSESLTTTLAAKPKGAGWWVFAYGSLLWNPLFPFAEARPGDRCAGCIGASASTRWRRAAPRTRPGLVLGLDRGGACTGVVYRMPAPVAIDELHLLWRREMVTGSYRPKWVTVQSRERRLSRWHSRCSHDHPQYAGKLVHRHRGAHHRQRRRRVRILARLSRAHARRARLARHRRSLSRADRGEGGAATRRTHCLGNRVRPHFLLSPTLIRSTTAIVYPPQCENAASDRPSVS